MAKFNVTVEKNLTCSGIVEVEADNAESAEKLVGTQISNGDLEMSTVEWEDSKYEEVSFGTTGVVEDA